MSLALIGAFAGGIGLFLLGMKLMTDGLKLAAGDALRRVLAESTRTPLRGLFSGVLITSMVQSSSAVTVAVIGFVNAGLLSLTQTIYVIYGTNIGTTMTSWLVALVGFTLDIKAFALPLIGIGMLLRLTGSGQRDAIGQALTGFGLFFLGIDILKGSFTSVSMLIDLETLAASGIWSTGLFLGIGLLLTFLMQSSSAAMALTLTAAASGIVPLHAAAATVIGANVGTTTTAALAVIGATANAQRTAAAHVLFNLITGMVALVLLQPLVLLSDVLAGITGTGQVIAATLALFHTLFNLMGVALLWPFTRRLVTFLDGWFVPRVEALGRPHYLDRNVLSTPSLALDALVLECGRISGHARTMALAALSTDTVASKQLATDMEVVEQLQDAVDDFAVNMQRSSLPADISASLPNLLRTARYFKAVANLAREVAAMQEHREYLSNEALATEVIQFRREAANLFDGADPLLPGFKLDSTQNQLAELESHYQKLKATLLRAGAEDRIRVHHMVAILDQLSAVHRMAQQMVKGTHYLDELWQLASQFRHVVEAPPTAEAQSA